MMRTWGIPSIAKYLDPSCTFWTSLENRPSSWLNALLQKKRGVRSGLPDVKVIFRQRPVFMEMKSRAGIASEAPRRIRDELVAAGCEWWLERRIVRLNREGLNEAAIAAGS